MYEVIEKKEKTFLVKMDSKTFREFEEIKKIGTTWFFALKNWVEEDFESDTIEWTIKNKKELNKFFEEL